jgi:glycerol-3-phosphate O-acyltransferase/dihydroxyacetone phosphate acyltransferase
MGRNTPTLEAGVYGLLRLVFGTAARAYYRRIEVRHADRIPASGPLLVVANHPASLTDVLVLGIAIRRRLHFVAYSGLFKPWPLGLVLRLAGTIPVYRRSDDPTQVHRNEEMFRECNELLDGGGAVLIFPEGTSASDRKVEKLKTGAARMALANQFRPGHAGALTLLPIGVHFVERTSFKSDVILTVGRPIDLEPLRVEAARDEAAAVRALTDRIQVAIERLILHVPSDDLAGLVHDIEKLYREELRALVPDAPDLARARAVADCVEWYRGTDPERLYRLWRAVSTYRRKLEALDLHDATVRTLGREGVRDVRVAAARALAGLPFAAAGALVNWAPYRFAATAGGWFAHDPTRLAFSRIVCGTVAFPAAYLLAGWALVRGTTWSAGAISAALVACVPLGLFSLGYFRWLRRERQRLRVAWLAAFNRRIVAKLRAERRALIAQFDAARTEYVAAATPGGGGPGA